MHRAEPSQPSLVFPHSQVCCGFILHTSAGTIHARLGKQQLHLFFLPSSSSSSCSWNPESGLFDSSPFPTRGSHPAKTLPSPTTTTTTIAALKSSHHSHHPPPREAGRPGAPSVLPYLPLAQLTPGPLEAFLATHTNTSPDDRLEGDTTDCAGRYLAPSSLRSKTAAFTPRLLIEPFDSA